jgi:hypothetical protein
MPGYKVALNKGRWAIRGPGTNKHDYASVVGPMRATVFATHAEAVVCCREFGHRFCPRIVATDRLVKKRRSRRTMV